MWLCLIFILLRLDVARLGDSIKATVRAFEVAITCFRDTPRFASLRPGP